MEQLDSRNSSTEVLTVNGQIFFDGDLTMNNNDTAVYQGIATIYVRGVVTLSNNTELCGVSGCDGSWDPSANSLTFATYNPGGLAFDISNNGVYQGGAIVEGDYYLTNNAANWGPVISDEFTVRNNSEQRYVHADPDAARDPSQRRWRWRLADAREHRRHVYDLHAVAGAR